MVWKTKLTDLVRNQQSKMQTILISNSSFSKHRLTAFKLTIISNFIRNLSLTNLSKYQPMQESSKHFLEIECRLDKRKAAENDAEPSLKKASRIE